MTSPPNKWAHEGFLNRAFPTSLMIRILHPAMSDVGGTVVYLLTRIEVLQSRISEAYRDVGEATREIALINNLLVQLKPVPRASPPHLEEARVHPAHRPLQPKRAESAENLKTRYPRFPFVRSSTDTNIPE